MFEFGVLIGLTELALCFLLGLAVTYSAYRHTLSAFRGLDGLKSLQDNNLAVGVVFAAAIIGAAIIVQAALFPAMSTLRTALQSGGEGLGVGSAVLWMLTFSVVALGLALACLRLSMRVTLWLTRGLDEMAEISNNNSAVALLLGAIVVANSLFLSRGIASLLLALVPYPETGTIQIMGEA